MKDGSVGIISDKFHINEELDNKIRALGLDPGTIRHNRKNLSWKEEETLKNKGIDISDFYYRVVENVRIRNEDLPKVRYIQSLREKTKELIFKESGGYSDMRSITSGLTSKPPMMNLFSNMEIS